MFKFRDSLQMYQLNHSSDDLFAMLQDYTLDSRLSRLIMNNLILLRMGVLYPLYNESEMMKFAIDNFFDEYAPIIKQLLDANDEYNELNPFDNTNWKEQYSGTRNDDNRIDTTAEQKVNGAIEDFISAYDSNGYQQQNKETEDSTTNSSRNVSEDKDRAEAHTLVHTGKEGSENYSKMLEDARDAAKFDIYDWIINHLERAVCLGVY